MTEQETKIYQEVAANLSNAIGMALQTANDAIHHAMNKNFKGAELALQAQKANNAQQTPDTENK